MAFIMTRLKVYKMYFDYIHPHGPFLSCPTDPQFSQLVSDFFLFPVSLLLLQFSSVWPHTCCVAKDGL